MPIRRSLASRSTLASASAATRAQIAPTVRHAIRISCPTAVLEVCTASHVRRCRPARRASPPVSARRRAAMRGCMRGQRIAGQVGTWLATWPGPFLDPYPPVSAAARASWVARACDAGGTRSTLNSAMDQSGGWSQLAVRQVLAGVDTIGRACAFTPRRVPPPVRRASAGVGQSCLSLPLPVVIPVVAGSDVRKSWS
jgi:hypothetical protein